MTTNAAAAAAKAPEFQTLPLEKVRLSKSNPRRHIDEDDLKDLAASIRAQGILEPPIVRPVQPIGAYELVVGERRYRAAKLAGLTETTFKIQQMSDSEALEAQLVENLQRQDVSALDEGLGYKALLAVPLAEGATTGKLKKYDVKAIAERVGKSPGYVYARVKLAELIADGQLALAKKLITPGHAVLIARLKEGDQQRALQWALGRHYNDQRSVAKLIAECEKEGRVANPEKGLREFIQEHCFRSLEHAPWNKEDALLLPKAGSCTDCPKNSNNRLDGAEIGKGVCTDDGCYQQKKEAFVLVQLGEAKKKLKSVATPVLLSEQYNAPPRYAGAQVLPWHQVNGKIVAAGSCNNITPAVHLDGPNKGRIDAVCLAPKCEVHGVKPKKRGAARSAPTARQPIDQSRSINDAIAQVTDIEVGRTLFTKVKVLSGDALRELVEFMEDQVYGVDREVVGAMLSGSDVCEVREDVADDVIDRIVRKGTDEQRTRLILATMLTLGSAEHLPRAYKVDIAGIRKRVAARAKQKCRICGCTELTACKLQPKGQLEPVGCSWAQKDLCSNPACLKKAGVTTLAQAVRMAIKKDQRSLTSAKPKPRAKAKRAKPRAIAKPKVKVKSKAKPKSKARR